ncbi:MAG: hypothetical protein WCB12_19370 [Bryobacteraceae bacterium]
MRVLGWLVGLCIWADVLLPPGLAIYALLRWRGGWRIAAAMPLLVVIPAAVSFYQSRRGGGPVSSLSILLYVLLALALCSYSVVVLILYLRRKPRPS